MSQRGLFRRSFLAATLRPRPPAETSARLRIALNGVEGYHLILIDCPRALGAITSAALTAAGKVLVVDEPTKDSLKGVGVLLETTEAVRKHYKPSLLLAGVVLNRLGRTKARSVRADQLREARV